ncbi:putative membrane protein YfcA [Bradyrhizobium sp. USDA 3051]
MLLLGSLPGIVVGSFSATRVPETVLRLTLASVLFVVAGKIMFAELHLSSAFETALAWTH